MLGTLIVFNSETIVDGIRQRWLFGKGVESDIIGEYSKSSLGQEYKAFKVSKNSRAGGNVDLTLTGALGRGLTIKKRSERQYEIFSTDYKFERIAIKYGIEQFNLDQQQIEELFDMLYFTALENYLDNVYLI
jgi:hypothetical protein